MANPLECRSCGYVCHVEDTKCPYCGTPTNNGATEKRTFNINRPEMPRFTSTSRETANKDSEINICWLVFWVIVFWPIAIIYVVIKLANRNNK